ncbi:MAG: DUF4838 domain-containing protein [Lentisphaeria bacterium]|nr:DUF4838 domain-containing protein [Lentisphaeria bacterium]
MKHFGIFFAFFCLALPCFSADLVIAENHSSNYQIVLPDDVGDAALLKYVDLGGKLIQSAVEKAAGAQLPLVRESQKEAGKPSIYIGATKALKAAGLSADGFAMWEHAIAVKGADIFLYGSDIKNPFKNKGDFFLYFTLGSLKSACVFAEKFIDTRVVGMTRGATGLTDGVRTLSKERIAVPEDFSYRQKARFLNCDYDKGGVLYCVANNFYPDCGAAYDVHYHAKAIPQEKYFKDHPEYFALIKGRRYYHHAGTLEQPRPQYCLSNPEVQELIYQNALERADAGYRVVEFGQSDGFMGCECENCQKMYDTKDWGEKLWCLHRDLAARLKAERPDVQVAISCYGPTHKLPKSFDKFPVDMIIDMAPVDARLLEGWKKFNVVGMAAWTYFVGGAYKPCGYSPASSFAELQAQNRYYRSTPVTSLYNCGILTAKAMSGPWIYAWGRWCNDENEDAAEILHDYCLYSFGEKAAPAFEKFFQLVDERMQAHSVDGPIDYNDFSQDLSSMAIMAWQARYPREVVEQLTKYFDEAVSLCDKGNGMVPPLMTEFTYLRLSANVCNALKEWKASASWEDRLVLADAIEARNNFIKGLPTKDGYLIGPGFEFVEAGKLQAGGNMSGTFGDIFDKDPEQFRRKPSSSQAVKVAGFDDPAWKDAPEYSLIPLKSTYPQVDAKFQVGFTEDAFLFKIVAPLDGKVDETPLKHDGNLGHFNATKEVFLSQDGEIVQLVFSPVAGSALDVYFAPGKARDSQWNCEWSHSDRVEDGIWYSEVTVPFKSVGFTYATGKELLLQIGFSTWRYARAYGWNISDSGNFADLTGFGKLKL